MAAVERDSARFDPRAIVIAALLASALLLASTSWALLIGVTAWLIPAWLLSRPDHDAVPLGLVLAGLLAFAALTGGLLSGAGLELTLRRVLRAVLLVAVATWMRAAAGPGGLREAFRRALRRLRALPAVNEAAALMEGLDPGRVWSRPAARRPTASPTSRSRPCRSSTQSSDGWRRSRPAFAPVRAPVASDCSCGLQTRCSSLSPWRPGWRCSAGDARPPARSPLAHSGARVGCSRHGPAAAGRARARGGSSRRSPQPEPGARSARRSRSSPPTSATARSPPRSAAARLRVKPSRAPGSGPTARSTPMCSRRSTRRAAPAPASIRRRRPHDGLRRPLRRARAHR